MTLRFREAFAVLVGRKVASPPTPRPILPGGDFVGQWREAEGTGSIPAIFMPTVIPAFRRDSASVTYRHYEGQRIGDDPDVARDMISGEVV